MKKITLSILIVMSALSSLIAKENRPNIILFLTDDQTRNSTGIYGNEQVKTPNMDKLATNGVVFSNNYATTSICMASRACIMTGMYEYKTGCNFDIGGVDGDKFKKSYPLLLKEAGYFIGFAGKFGFAVNNRFPVEKSFDWYAGGSGASQTAYETSKNKLIAKYAKEYPHSTRAYGAACKEFLQLAKESGKPFCLSMSFKAPHTPNTPDPFFNDIYKDVVWKKPLNYGKNNAEHLSMQAKLGRQYLSYSKSYATEKEFQSTMRNYNQLIYGVDYAIGMILEELEKQGLAENTIVIHTSDNAYSCGAHSFGGKVLPYEEASKTPLIIYDPRAKKSGDIWRKAVSANIDLAPTILEYAGVEIPSNMDGKSLVKVLADPKEKVRDALPLIQIWGSMPTMAFSAVTEDYKYIYYPYAEKIKEGEELYDIKNDKYEMKNLIDNPEYSNVLKEMKAHYDKNLQAWKEAEAMTPSHEAFATIFDRNMSWEKKKAVLPKSITDGRHNYENLLKSIKYTGDKHDYEAILKFFDAKK